MPFRMCQGFGFRKGVTGKLSRAYQFTLALFYQLGHQHPPAKLPAVTHILLLTIAYTMMLHWCFLIAKGCSKVLQSYSIKLWECGAQFMSRKVKTYKNLSRSIKLLPFYYTLQSIVTITIDVFPIYIWTELDWTLANLYLCTSSWLYKTPPPPLSL